MIHTDDGERITEAKHLAAVIKGTGKTSMKAAAKAMIIRAPLYLVADIDAMAKMANQSRNALVIQLLTVAIEETKAELDAETVSRIDGEAFQLLGAMCAEDETETVEI